MKRRLLTLCALTLSATLLADNSWYTTTFGGLNYGRPNSKTDFSAGYLVGLSGGKRFPDHHARYELEFAYRNNGHTTFTQNAYSLTFNSLIDFLPNRLLNPYAGFGAGATYQVLDISDPQNVSFIGNDKGADVILQEIVGISTDKQKRTQFGLEYRHTHSGFQTRNNSVSLNCGIKF